MKGGLLIVGINNFDKDNTPKHLATSKEEKSKGGDSILLLGEMRPKGVKDRDGCDGESGSR